MFGIGGAEWSNLLLGCNLWAWMEVERPLLSVYGPMFDVADATPRDGRTPRPALTCLLLLLLNKEMMALWSSTSIDRGRGGEEGAPPPPDGRQTQAAAIAQ